jgi:hypothetical protein
LLFAIGGEHEEDGEFEFGDGGVVIRKADEAGEGALVATRLPQDAVDSRENAS